MNLDKPLLLRPDGSTQEFTPENGKDFSLAELYRIIDCSLVEIVRLTRGYILVVDEEGLINEKEYNPFASVLYGDIIVGNALLCKNSEVL